MTIPTDAWVKIGTASAPAFSKDGTKIFHLRGTKPLGSGLPQVWVMDADGRNPMQLSTHDEKVALLRRAPNDDRLIWGIDAGGDERQQFHLRQNGETRALTAAPGVIHDLGGFSPDGSKIYYNCDRDGHAQIWVMNADGTGQRKLFTDEYVNWFPHPSPDGKTVLYLAYPPGTLSHPANLPVALCLMDPDGQNRGRILEFTGGQGTINVPCWAPDGKAFAYVRYIP